jgi:hypothetical protein
MVTKNKSSNPKPKHKPKPLLHPLQTLQYSFLGILLLFYILHYTTYTVPPIFYYILLSLPILALLFSILTPMIRIYTEPPSSIEQPSLHPKDIWTSSFTSIPFHSKSTPITLWIQILLMVCILLPYYTFLGKAFSTLSPKSKEKNSSTYSTIVEYIQQYLFHPKTPGLPIFGYQGMYSKIPSKYGNTFSIVSYSLLTAFATFFSSQLFPSLTPIHPYLYTIFLFYILFHSYLPNLPSFFHYIIPTKPLDTDPLWKTILRRCFHVILYTGFDLPTIEKEFSSSSLSFFLIQYMKTKLWLWIFGGILYYIVMSITSFSIFTFSPTIIQILFIPFLILFGCSFFMNHKTLWKENEGLFFPSFH